MFLFSCRSVIFFFFRHYSVHVYHTRFYCKLAFTVVFKISNHVNIDKNKIQNLNEYVNNNKALRNTWLSSCLISDYTLKVVRTQNECVNHNNWVVSATVTTILILSLSWNLSQGPSGVLLKYNNPVNISSFSPNIYCN